MIDYPQRFLFNDPDSAVKQKWLADEIFHWLKENVKDGEFNMDGTYLSFRVSLYCDEDATAFKLKFGV